MAMNCVLGVLFCMLLLLLGSSKGAPEESLVTSLPGFQGTFPSKHYSGYVDVNGKNLFYYFVMSERNPKGDPVVLWLNGGPGCSSFDGFVYEHGPFNFEAGHSKEDLPKLHLNKYSWSKVSNIIYLESPCGVGFSYSTDTSKYVTGDLDTASTTHAFLLKWFDLFAEFVSNPFYLSGESYAGVYVPTLAAELVKGIQTGVKPAINFKGYLVGNGVTGSTYDDNALLPFAHGMGLISDDIYKEVLENCGTSYYENKNSKCSDSIEKVQRALKDLNGYDILEPCYHYPESKGESSANQNTSLPLSFQMLGKTDKPLAVRKRMFGRAWPLWATVKAGPATLWPNLDEHFHVYCVNDDVATTWLNNAEVRKAIHAAPANVSGSWDICTDSITYELDAGNMIPYHKNLTAQHYRALIYSGDHDMCVPFTGTEAWTRSLGYKIVDEWRPWMSDDQVAGYLQEYDNNITFITIKGSGHTVPEYKPQESLEFYSRWLEGKKI